MSTSSGAVEGISGWLRRSAWHASAFRLRLGVLKVLAREPQRPAVLGDGPHEVLRRSVRDVGLHLQRHLYAYPRSAGQVLDDLLGDPSRLACHPEGVQLDSGMKPPRLGRTNAFAGTPGAT